LSDSPSSLSHATSIDAHATRLEFDRPPSALQYMVRAVLPTTRRRDLAPPIAARWHGHRPDARSLAEFRRIAGYARAGGDDATLPLLYPHTFGFRLTMAVLTHPRFPVPIWGVLQTRNQVTQHRPVASDAALDFETRVLPGRVVPKGAEFDLRTTVHVDGTLVWESVVTFFTRGRFSEAGATSSVARSPSDFGDPIDEWTMADADHLRFGHFTGDYNGIHLWDWYARRMGFHRALYHPPRVLGLCLARLPTPGLRATSPAAAGTVRLDAWIKGPVPHGARVRLHASTKPSTTSFALFAGDEARPAIVGRLHAAEPDSP
jgi:acyl dehydratase